MKTIYRIFAGTVCAAVLALLSLVVYAQSSIPDNIYVAQGEEIYINDYLSLVSVGENPLPIHQEPIVNDEYGNHYSINLKLFESLPIKEVQVQVVERTMVIPGGMPFGIKMHTSGIMVVGMTDIQNGSKTQNPAKDAGLKVGDIITHIDDQPLTRNQDVADSISASGGDAVKLTVLRDEAELELVVQPVLSELDGSYKAGIWVRDSSAGIGTLTYCNPMTLAFAGLGHAVCDIDTGEQLPLSTGEIVEVEIAGVNAGQNGKPGELKGSFTGTAPIGSLLLNCDRGVYGVLSDEPLPGEPIPIAMRREITTGPATIRTTISGSQPQEFDILIEKVNYTDGGTAKNMVIRVTDEALIQQTGGIVQGMSGSPIIQNGKLVGAVTHVFVNDPTRGYGIFIENMLEAAA